MIYEWLTTSRHALVEEYLRLQLRQRRPLNGRRMGDQGVELVLLIIHRLSDAHVYESM